MSDNFDDRRRFKRCNIQLPFEIEKSGRTTKAHSLNISVGGACIHSSEPISANSKVYISILAPKKEEEDVREIKAIGIVLRVEEIATATGATNAIGLKFMNISEEDMLSLKDYLKKEYWPKREPGAKPDDEAGAVDEVDLDEIEAQGLEVTVAPIDTSEMTFFQRLFLREDYSHSFVNWVKSGAKVVLFILLLYIVYNIILLALKVIDAV